MPLCRAVSDFYEAPASGTKTYPGDIVVFSDSSKAL
jgi:hypothetical protein